MAVIQSNSPIDYEQTDFVYIGRRAIDFISEEELVTLLETQKIKYVIIADIYKKSYNARLWRLYRTQATVPVEMMWYGLLVFDDKVQRGKYNLII